MTDIKLSAHFKLSEFCECDEEMWGDEVRNRNFDLARTEPYLTNIKTVCETILEPVRRHFGNHVIILSGMRYSVWNRDEWEGLDYEIRRVRQKKAYQGVSQHTEGEAVDFTVSSVPTRRVWEWLWQNSKHPFGQVIYEVEGRNSWVHASTPGKMANGDLIYGEVKQPYQDKTGRWYYKFVERIDRWET